MAWDNAVITNIGNKLYSEAFIGEGITISKVLYGGSVVAEASLLAQTQVTAPQKNLDIVDIKSSDDGKIVCVRINNIGVETAYIIKQIGIYARKTVSGSDILFALNQDSTGIRVPTVLENPEFVYTFFFKLPFKNTPDFSFTLDPQILATKGELLKHEQDGNIHIIAEERANWNSKADGSPTYETAAELTRLTSGEKITVALGKIARVIIDFIAHISDGVKHITAEERVTWNSKANGVHKHGVADINDLSTVLSDKADLVDGKVPTSQLPSYISDAQEYDTVADFPSQGKKNIIYFTKDTNLTYRWGGTGYVEISPSIAIGNTAETAFRGDLGQQAYNHTTANNNPHGVTAEQVGLGNVPNVSTNDQTPTFTEAKEVTVLTSGEKLALTLGKLAKVVSAFITHIADKVGHITADERTKWNSGGSGKKAVTFVIGTTTAGHTADEVDYLCDGVDDDVEINAALSALPSYGGTVLLRAGTYNTSATINITKSYVTLCGEGMYSTIITKSTSSTITLMLLVKSANNSEIHDITINLSGSGTDISLWYSDNSTVKKSDNVKIHNCQIQNANQGINCLGTTGTTIDNCNIHDCQYGIQTGGIGQSNSYGSSKHKITNCDIINCEQGIYAPSGPGSTNLTISYCYIATTNISCTFFNYSEVNILNTRITTTLNSTTEGAIYAGVPSTIIIRGGKILALSAIGVYCLPNAPDVNVTICDVTISAIKAFTLVSVNAYNCDFITTNANSVELSSNSNTVLGFVYLNNIRCNGIIYINGYMNKVICNSNSCYGISAGRATGKAIITNNYVIGTITGNATGDVIANNITA